jgi:hypothetical protein
MKDARSNIIYVICNALNIGKAIEEVAGDLPIPHCAFMIYPGDERRKLLNCLIKPVLEWALDKAINMLNSHSADAAYTCT